MKMLVELPVAIPSTSYLVRLAKLPFDVFFFKPKTFMFVSLEFKIILFGLKMITDDKEDIIV